ncbi:MAG: type II secretion system protein [Lentisphaerae bacterium]|jgi:prepilin-type N-terminal cleavage/methylation domain-containing protein|nr:type II secretion system protein [Lentisphaerota bacterium]
MKTTSICKGGLFRWRAARSGFTLVELLVVIGMIAIILGALTTSVNAAQERARIQRATSDVKIIAQAILSTENFAQGGEYKIKTMALCDADSSSLDFIVGRGGSTDSGDKIPATLMASMNAGGKMLDPWGKPYQVKIEEGKSLNISSPFTSVDTGFSLPNIYRLSPEERK